MPSDPPPILNYADRDIGRLVTIAKFPDPASAHIAALKLESEGIEAVVTVPASLNVLADDEQAAIAILETTPARDCLIRTNMRPVGS